MSSHVCETRFCGRRSRGRRSPRQESRLSLPAGAYVYVSGRPTVLVDPLGLYDWNDFKRDATGAAGSTAFETLLVKSYARGERTICAGALASTLVTGTSVSTGSRSNTGQTITQHGAASSSDYTTSTRCPSTRSIRLAVQIHDEGTTSEQETASWVLSR